MGNSLQNQLSRIEASTGRHNNNHNFPVLRDEMNEMPLRRGQREWKVFNKEQMKKERLIDES